MAGVEDLTWMLDDTRELRRTEADLTVAVHEATRARAELRSEKATNAELRRQLAGVNGLLGKAESEVALRQRAETFHFDRANRLSAQRQAVLDLCDQALATGKRLGFVTDERFWASQVRTALGAAGTPDA